MTAASSIPATRPGIRLTVPSLLEHATLVRACLRDALAFRTDDDESSFLLAVTEIVINAIEASAHGADVADRPDVVVELWGGPDPRVEVSDRAGGMGRDVDKPDHLGAGMSIAAAFVSDLRVETDDDGTRVRIGLGSVAT